jgi:tetratricopeptide (TPR) repeat protein
VLRFCVIERIQNKYDYMEQLLKTIQKYILYVTLFLVPVAFASISPNPYIVVKLVVLVSGVSLALIVWCLRVLISGKIEFRKGVFDFPVLLVAIAYFVSALMVTPNKMEAILLPGTATAIISSAFLYFLINQYEDKRGFVLTLLVSGVLFAFVTLLSAFGALETITQLPSFVKAAGFTPEGGFLPATIFLVILLIVSIGTAVLDKNIVGKIVSGVAAIVIVLGLVSSIINVVPGGKFAPRFPSIATSWSVAVDAIKGSPVLGVGPGNYLTAFSRFRPISYNQSDLWAVKFATATNFYVTVLTETGLLGIIGLILAGFLIYKRVSKYFFKREGQHSVPTLETLYLVSLVVLLLLLAFFPATLLITFLLFVLLSFASSSRKTVLHLETQESDSDDVSTVSSKLPALLVTIPLLLVSLYVLYWGAKITHAEYTFNKALIALSQNDAQKTLDSLNKAINENPRVDRYHMTAAQVAILLANAVAQKKDISDTDRQTIATLVQTAIAQGKAGVALNVLRSTNWEVLAQIYRSIIPIAKEADQFAIQTASQAVALDPYNPNLRVSLGGIYYAKGDFEMAVKVLETAVAAKSNHPNAYYNLAFAYRERGDLAKAETAMSQVLALVDSNSKDYQVAKKALEDIQAKKKESDGQKGEELNPPQQEADKLDPKLNLPSGSEPPTDGQTDSEVKVSPTPLASPPLTPTGQQTASPTPTSSSSN